MRTLPDDDTWAVTAFAEAELGALRRPQRFVAWATALAPRPGTSWPEACGEPARLKAADRFFDHAAIDPQHLLNSHGDAPLTRLAPVPLVFAVQDSTALAWTAPPAPTGLGPLGPSAHRGLLGHTPLACTPERGPLGVLAQQGWARAPDDIGKRATRKQRPSTEKDRPKWRTSVEAVVAARGAGPQTRLVSGGAREADGYALLALERPTGVERLLRAAWDRCVPQPEHDVWATVAARPVAAPATVQVSHRGAPPARPATLAVRWGPLPLGPPRHRKRARLPAVPRWAGPALEEAPPAGTAPIAWLWLSPCAVHTTAAAVARVDWYACRWGVEVWHKIVQSGGRIAARQLETAERLQRCLALSSVMAWRIFYATMLGRVVPDVSCTVLLALEEWQALSCAIHRTPTPSPEPPSRRQAVHWIAQLGSFMGRRGDGEPGAMVLWKGFQHLAALTTMSCIMRPLPSKRKNVGKT